MGPLNTGIFDTNEEKFQDFKYLKTKIFLQITEEHNKPGNYFIKNKNLKKIQ